MSTPTETSASTAPTHVSFPEAWVAYIAPFATTLGKNIEEVTTMLKPVVGEPGDDAIALLKDATMSPDADIKGVLNGTPIAVANKAIKLLRNLPPPQAPTSAAMTFAGVDILPDVPDDTSWLSSLRAGGVLKVEQPTIISAIRAALAYRAGLYEIPELLAKRMEQFADENREPVSSDYFKIRKQITRRSYAELFEAIDGLDGSYVTDARKNQLFSRIDASLWPALISFQGQLKSWVDVWSQGALNPTRFISAMAKMVEGGGGVVSPGMQVPDTAVLHDAADSFSDELNNVFAGTGVQIASALAYDALKIKETLENPQLPALLGAANRDQMLRLLGVEVSATYPRMEKNLIKFVVSIIKIKDLAAGNEELQYFDSLNMLGSQIPWDQLGMAKRSGARPAMTSRGKE